MENIDMNYTVFGLNENQSEIAEYDNDFFDENLLEENNIPEDFQLKFISNVEKQFILGNDDFLKDKDMLLEGQALVHILTNNDVTNDESDFLDAHDSRFVGHQKASKLTKRETLCVFLNQFFEWTDIHLDERRETSIVFSTFWEEYIDFCKNKLNHGRYTTLKAKEVKRYLGLFSTETRELIGSSRPIVFRGLPILRVGINKPNFVIEG